MSGLRHRNRAFVVKLMKDIIANTRANKSRQINREINAKGAVKAGRPPKRRILRLPDGSPWLTCTTALQAEPSPTLRKVQRV